MSKEYWNNRYDKKLGSGQGSIGKVRKYKHKILGNYLENYEKYSFLDFGNGDMNFWKDNPPINYVGIDISDRIQAVNRAIIKREFITQDLSTEINRKAEVVICFGVLFHILEEVDYINILINLCESSEKYIFIYTWMSEPKGYEPSYQKYRDFGRYRHIFVSRGFKLLNVFWSKKIDAYGAMYVFRRD